MAIATRLINEAEGWHADCDLSAAMDRSLDNAGALALKTDEDAAASSKANVRVAGSGKRRGHAQRRTQRGRGRAASPVTDAIASAKAARLRYVGDAEPWFTRKRTGKGFAYLDADGGVVRDLGHLRRIRALVIPPAWSDVWICAIPNGHLQASGRDARGRKQYRYHARWRTIRDENKFARMVPFAKRLPRIRAVVNEHLQLPGLPREKVLATIVRLMDLTGMRVGNDEYQRANGSFGLTTLRNHHVQISGSTLQFRFRSKGGKQQARDVTDRRLASIVKRCQDIPGFELFQYLDEQGVRCSVDSGDVNAYLRTHSGRSFSAKDFRTWNGTVLAAALLVEYPAPESESEARANVVEAIKAVAQQLGNTPAICRRCYVHPAVLTGYACGALADASTATKECDGLRPAEARVLAFLNSRRAHERSDAPTAA